MCFLPVLCGDCLLEAGGGPDGFHDLGGGIKGDLDEGFESGLPRRSFSSRSNAELLKYAEECSALSLNRFGSELRERSLAR